MKVLSPRYSVFSDNRKGGYAALFYKAAERHRIWSLIPIPCSLRSLLNRIRPKTYRFRLNPFSILISYF